MADGRIDLTRLPRLNAAFDEGAHLHQQLKESKQSLAGVLVYRSSGTEPD